MRLADYIDRNMTAILAAWDSFACTQLPAAGALDRELLRDHAQEMLQTIVKDLRTPQSAQQQARKSLGLTLQTTESPGTAAEIHGTLRAKWGFDIRQLVAEFRALRASVLSLWSQACAPAAMHLEDMMRFNEAIDQAVAESVGFFSDKVSKEQNLLVGALGHDMRSPLHVIRMSASMLERFNAGEKVSTVAARIVRSSDELRHLLDDLVDFNRTNLGLALAVSPEEVDLAPLFQSVLDQLCAGYPDRKVKLRVTADGRGVWDPQRLRQLLGNLVLNAFKYGASQVPVIVTVEGNDTEVQFSVANRGVTIDPSLLRHIFEPLIRGNHAPEGSDKAASMGLGLYIARQIARAHGGDVSARSIDGETTFLVSLPRAAHSSKVRFDTSDSLAGL